MMPGILDAFRCVDGGWSCMRILCALVVASVLVMWIVFCFVQGEFIQPGEGMTAIILGGLGAKALQTPFERRFHNTDTGEDA